MQAVFKDGTVLSLEVATPPAAQASAPVEQVAPVRKTEIKGATAAPEKSDAQVDVDPLLSPELRAQLEADRVSQLMIDDPAAYEQYMMDAAIERERQLGSEGQVEGQSQ